MLTKANQWMNKVYSNPYVGGFVMMFLILYASLAAPKLPPFIAKVFGNPVFRLLFMILILIIKKYDATLAILVAIAFALSLQTFNRYESQSALKALVKGKSTSRRPETVHVEDAMFDLSQHQPMFDLSQHQPMFDLSQHQPMSQSSSLSLEMPTEVVDVDENTMISGFDGMIDGSPLN